MIIQRNIFAPCKHFILNYSIPRKVCHSAGKFTLRQCHAGRVGLLETSAFVQQRSYIKELPCLVRIMHGDFVVHETVITDIAKLNGIILEDINAEVLVDNVPLTLDQEKSILDELCLCKNIGDLYQLMMCSDDKINPKVALAMMESLIKFESNFKENFVNKENFIAHPVTFVQDQNLEGRTMVYNRNDIISRYVKYICQQQNADYYLHLLDILCVDIYKGSIPSYLREISEKCLLKATAYEMTAEQVVKLAKLLHKLDIPACKDMTESLWTAVDNDHLQFEDLCKLFAILPYIDKSRHIVLEILERRIINYWHKLDSKNVQELIEVLEKTNCFTYRLSCMFSQWAHVNIHAISAQDLSWLIKVFNHTGFLDQNIRRTLTKYTEAKSRDLNEENVGLLAEYCHKTKFRSPQVLDAFADFFIANKDTIKGSTVHAIAKALGHLNYVPTNDFKFFDTLEDRLQNDFEIFPVDKFMEILLSCIFLQRYPLNIMNMTRHPFFYRRIQMLSSSAASTCVQHFKLLDKAFTLETNLYHGPRVIHFKFLRPYIRINNPFTHLYLLKPILSEVAGDERRVSVGCKLKGFPSTPLYTINFLLDTTIKLDIPHQLPSDIEDRFAILMQSSDHFDSDNEIMLGLYAMRVRHFRLMGLKVVLLDSSEVGTMSKQPPRLLSYVIKKIVEVARQ